MPVALAMGLGTTGKAVPLHNALESTPLARGDDVDELTRAELADVQALAALVRRYVGRLDLAQVAKVAGVLEVPARGPADLLGVAEAKLNGLVAVGHLRLELGNDARSDLEDGHGHEATLTTKVVSHADFSAHEPGNHDRLPLA